MRLTRNHILVGAAFLLTLNALGCAYKTEALPIRETAEYPNAQKHHDVHLAVELLEPTTCKRVLKKDPYTKGYAVAMVMMENHGQSRALVDAGRIQYTDSQGSLANRVSSEAAAKACEKGVVAHVLLFGWLSGLGAAEYNKKMLYDWKEKELTDQVILEPHASKCGLVFFKHNELAALKGGCLLVPVARSTEEQYEEVYCAVN